MEAISERIKRFLTLGYGYGSGSGSGYGCGYGSGSGSGSGYGYGYGSGCGYGYCIKVFNGYPIHIIDEIPTAITAIHGNTAKGYIINKDLTTQPCFIVKG